MLLEGPLNFCLKISTEKQNTPTNIQHRRAIAQKASTNVTLAQQIGHQLISDYTDRGSGGCVGSLDLLGPGVVLVH